MLCYLNYFNKLKTFWKDFMDENSNFKPKFSLLILSDKFYKFPECKHVRVDWFFSLQILESFEFKVCSCFSAIKP